MPENHVSTAADFRKLVADQEAYEPPERVVLPKSGLPVILRRPRPLAYTLLGISLPASLVSPPEVAEKAEPDAPESSIATDRLTREDLVQVSKWTVRLLRNVFVKPKLSLSPGFDEISPLWIPNEDQQFILAWTRGEVTSSGESLRTFRDDSNG